MLDIKLTELLSPPGSQFVCFFDTCGVVAPARCHVFLPPAASPPTQIPQVSVRRADQKSSHAEVWVSGVVYN